jgi:hypothetical protein
MYQPPQLPKKNNNNGFIVLAIIGGIVALILPNFMSKTTTTQPVYDDSYTTPSVASQTRTKFYRNTATPQTGVNNNPYGYDFDDTGNRIYDEEPPDFCDYFKCASDFWTNIPLGGYVVECQDGQFSHTGGTKYACAGHNGVKRVLYWH